MGLGGTEGPYELSKSFEVSGFRNRILEAASFMPGLFSGKQEQSAKDKFGHTIGFKV